MYTEFIYLSPKPVTSKNYICRNANCAIKCIVGERATEVRIPAAQMLSKCCSLVGMTHGPRSRSSTKRFSHYSHRKGLGNEPPFVRNRNYRDVGRSLFRRFVKDSEVNITVNVILRDSDATIDVAYASWHDR